MPEEIIKDEATKGPGSRPCLSVRSRKHKNLLYVINKVAKDPDPQVSYQVNQKGSDRWQGEIVFTADEGEVVMGFIDFTVTRKKEKKKTST